MEGGLGRRDRGRLPRPSALRTGTRCRRDGSREKVDPGRLVTAGGLAELVTKDTGYTARPADPRSLATAISSALAADVAQRAQLRAASRDLARTRYNTDCTVRDVLSRIAHWSLNLPHPAAAAN
jgi:hypothetical protein